MAAVVLAAGCHHHDRDYYRPGPSHHYNHNLRIKKCRT